MAKNDVAGMVGGAGLLTSIFSKLNTAVVRKGGTAEQIHRLTKPEGDTLIEQMADLIVGRGEIYELEVNYDDPQWQTIQRDRYAFVGDVSVTDYPVTETGTKTVRFRELEFDHDPTDQEILDEAERKNCRQPLRPEIETVIRKRYTAEQLGQNPRVGITGPAVRRGGEFIRAVVYGNGGGVRLGWGWVGRRWVRRYRFVVVCK